MKVIIEADIISSSIYKVFITNNHFIKKFTPVDSRHRDSSRINISDKIIDMTQT